MAATIVCPSEEAWEHIRSFLADLQDGGIVIPPGIGDKIEEQRGFRPEDIEEEFIEYDFGSDADIWIDVVNSPDHYAVDALAAAYQKEQE